MRYRAFRTLQSKKKRENSHRSKRTVISYVNQGIAYVLIKLLTILIYFREKDEKKKIKMKKDTTNKETIFNKENFDDSLIKEYKTVRKRKITALKGSVQSEKEKMEKCSALVLRYKPDSIQRAPIQNKNYIINT
ncbi:unnamed protein product [Moneuplotes crassus]|uniref:Uncharacterized protein n=1 Tax=Euplotes crassus TaxID=5936 RepID=A0AAD1XSS2_EUPCR|nr:unnamed protein product [Moneuplotes crassus]